MQILDFVIISYTVRNFSSTLNQTLVTSKQKYQNLVHCFFLKCVLWFNLYYGETFHHGLVLRITPRMRYAYQESSTPCLDYHFFPPETPTVPASADVLIS